MTCHINISSKYLGNVQIQRILFPHLKNEPAEEEEDWGWRESWEDEVQVQSDDGWLSRCLVAMSPLTDLLVFAYDNTAVILTAKWETGDKPKEERQVYHISYSGILKEDVPSDKITSLFCLPLPSQKRSLEGGAECVCLAAGYTSGLLRIFTEHGKLLLEQLFHEEAIYFISHDPQTDQLVLVYGAVIVCLENFALYQSLRACRNQLARVSAGTWGSIHIPPLSYKKWGLSGMGDVADCAYAGSVPNFRMDQLVATSLRRGASGGTESSDSADLVVTTGSEPYVGLYCVSEVAQPPMLSAIVSSLASALFSSVMMRWGDAQPPRQTKVEPPTPLPLRLGLFDKGRQGTRISLAPRHTLAAITDTFGRVLLFDLVAGTALRLWKGYRDAECGWIQLEEEMEGKTKKALFLVIYAQKRGIVEIWAMQQGPRVAAFNVSKSARLLQVSHTLSRSPCACYLLDSDGSIYTFTVPFLCSFNEVNCKRTKDVHVLKEIRTCLKEIPAYRERALSDLCQLVLSMKTANILQQALDGIIKCQHVDIASIQKLISTLRIHLEGQEQLAYDWKIILQTCVHTEQLMTLYETLTTSLTTTQEEPPQTITSEYEAVKALDMTEMEQSHLVWALPLYSQLEQLPGTMELEPITCISQFLQGFHLFPSHLLKSEWLPLQPQLEDASKASLGKFLFHTALVDGFNLKALTSALDDSRVAPQELMECLIRYWLSSDLALKPSSWQNFSRLALGFLLNEDGWLGDLRSLAAHSPNLPAAHLGCLLLRELCNRRALAQPCGDWESIDMETECWATFAAQLQTLLPLQLLLGSHPRHKHQAPVTFSIESLQAIGPGAITDLVAKWSLDQGVSCKELFDTPPCDEFETIHSLEFVRVALARLRRELPHSLEPGGLAVTCAWEHLARWMASGFSQECHLEECSQCLGLLPPCPLRLGICMMIWKTFVLKKLEALAFLIEKVGKTPKARLCLRDVELSDQHLDTFLELCHQLLVFMVEQQPSAGVEVASPQPELWGDGATGGPSLVALALAQEPPVFGLLEHHLQLVLCLQLVVRCQLRSVHPLSMFHPLIRQAFFKSLSGRGVRGVEDPSLVEPRQQFVVKAVAGLAGQLAEVLDICQTDLEVVRPHTGAAARWLDRTVKLAHSWDLPSGPAYRHWVVELYSAGLDFVAEEYLRHVSDRGMLGMMLYQIAGLRIYEEIFEKEFSIAKQSHFTKHQRDWIQKLPKTGHQLRYYHPRLLHPTVALLEAASKLMGSTEKFGAEGRMAEELLTSLRNMAAASL